VSSYRPLPAYDGSVGELPATDVDNNYLLARYGITKPTLFKRRDALVENGWVTPTRVAQRVYYSAQDVHLLDCVHYWATKAYNLTEVIHHLRQQESAYKNGGAALEDDDNAFEPLSSKPIDIRAENSTTDLVVKGLQTSAKDLQLLGEEFVERFAQKVGEAVKQAVPRDVLAGHDFLSRAAEKRYLLTGKILAEGLGLKSASVSGWEDRTEKHGFLVVRVAKGQYRVEHLEGVEAA
jgi:hypothetical protein